jgi:hypothetical protein
VARLYPQALGSLFNTFYDSQGYGGVIRPRLHTGFEVLTAVFMNSSIFRVGLFFDPENRADMFLRNFG